jgi:hypothetical protein
MNVQTKSWSNNTSGMLKKAIPGFFSSQSKKLVFGSAPFFKHLRVREMRGASVHCSSRLPKIVFQQPASA